MFGFGFITLIVSLVRDLKKKDNNRQERWKGKGRKSEDERGVGSLLSGERSKETRRHVYNEGVRKQKQKHYNLREVL